MKHRSFLILILLCCIEARKYSRSVQIAGLKKVFHEYIYWLKQVNEEIMMVFDELSNHPVIDFVSATVAINPHHVVSFSNTSRLYLNKTAIVLMGSVT